MIACISMLIDHIGASLIEAGVLHSMETYKKVAAYMPWDWWTIDTVLRVIGRAAFPIYCFLLVEGFFHTRNIKKYGLRLALFAVISEVPFDMAFMDRVFYPGYQNVYFTLYFGLLAMMLASKVDKIWVKLLPCGLCMVLAELAHTDYGALGVGIISAIYLIHVIRGKTSPETGTQILPKWLYSGERGKANLKWFFYLFYPCHLVLLVVIRYLWIGFWV